MKALFFAINFIFGLVALMFGATALVSVFGPAQNYHALLFFGLGLVAMGGACFAVCGNCLCGRRRQDHSAS